MENDSDYEEIDQEVEQKKNKNDLKNKEKRRLIVVLEHANLELLKNKKNPQIINCDDHSRTIKEMKKSLEEYRPDITHQCLLSLLDSPLNKAGLLQVFIRTKKSVLIELNPKCRIPRTFKRFSGLITQLLMKLKVRSSENSEVLMKVIKNPITDHLPAGCNIVSTCEKSRLINTSDFVKSLNQSKPIVMVIGAMSQGDLDIDYATDSISVSAYPLSASVVCSKVCCAFEELWGIL